MINWKESSEDYFIANNLGYILIVSKIDLIRYYWVVYFEGIRIAKEYDGNEASAKKYAEQAMTKHIKVNE